MNGPAPENYLNYERSEDRSVKNFVRKKHLRTRHGQSCRIEVKESQHIGKDSQVWHQRKKRNQPDDVPGIVRGKEHHQSGSKRKRRRKERSVGIARTYK